jgi:ABC-type uncharacterized transport system substrate-binding protein
VPDVILTNGSAGVTPVLEATRTIPVVFVQVTDPVDAGLDLLQQLGKKLVDLRSEVIVAASTAATVAFQRETRTIPIVFVNAVDPVASGIVPRRLRVSRVIHDA